MSLPSFPLPRRLTVVLVSGLVVMSGTVHAGRPGFDSAPPRSSRADAARDNARPRQGRALADAVRRVERATGGEVLSAERVPFDGRNVSRIKVVDASGRVRVYMDDPQTMGARRTRGADDDND